MATAPALRVDWTGGGYLKRRREHAGLSVAEVALVYSADGALDRDMAGQLIERIEADAHVASDASLGRLRVAFRFDPHVYRNLVNDLPAGQLCRVCACSWTDPCRQRSGAPCHWTAAGDLCSRCAGPRP